MPLLFSVGQHGALQAVSRLLCPGEKLFAFLDDKNVLCRPARVVEVYGILQAELWRHAGIQINGGKTQVWNQAGVYPRRCEVLERIAQQEDPEATVWSGSGVPTEQQVARILAARWGMQISCLRSWRGSPETITFWSPESRELRTFKARGFCCCTVRRHGPTTSCEWSALSWSEILQNDMIPVCGLACARF